MPRPPNPVELTCETCGKKFILTGWLAKRNPRFCSQSCRGRRGPVELTCERCGKKFVKPFWFIKKGRKFCSAKCKAQDPMEALMSKISIDDKGCWNYTGFCGDGGYGQIRCGGVRYSTHVLMWTLHHGPVPEGKVVRHTCVGNPKCINPDHLLIGTQKDNIQDCIDQGRFPKQKTCEDHRMAKLTNDNVREIRRLRNPTDGSKPPSYYKLAKRFGVSYTALYKAANKLQWKTLE